MWLWLLHETVLLQMRRLFDNGAVLEPKQEQIEAFAEYASPTTAGPGSSRLLSVAGDTAEVTVRGILTERFSFLAYLMGGGNTTYREIRAAIAEAEADPNVKSIQLAIESPGGTFAGLVETVNAIEATRKPTQAVVANMAASAAFGLAAATGNIRATNAGAHFGSVGAAKTFMIDENEVVITSTSAPDKIPDVTTDEGQAVVRKELDSVHALFIQNIARGLGVTTEKIDSDFGQGAVFLAEEALKRGMITSIDTRAGGIAGTSTATNGGNKTEAKVMTLEELMTQHPTVYSAVLDRGVQQERKRACAHLKLGEAYGCVDVAVAAVKDGTEMDATAMVDYVAAQANNGSINNRQDDDADADPGNTGGDDDEAKSKAGLAAILTQAGNACGVTVKV
jgi:ClpP class serine protease